MTATTSVLLAWLRCPRWPWVLLTRLEEAEENARCERGHRRDAERENGIFSSLLADLVEAFGGTSNTPKVMWYAHAGWACGPLTIEQISGAKTYLDCWQHLAHGKLTLQELADWQTFIADLAKTSQKVSKP